MCSGGLPSASSAGSRSCAAPHTREEATPALALRAVSTFRSLAPRGDSQSPTHGAVCAGFGMDLGRAVLVMDACSLTLLLHHGSCSSPSLVAPIHCIFWYRTLHAEAHRLAKLLWTKSRETPSLPRMASHSPLPAANHTPQPTSARYHSLPLPLSPALGTSHPLSATLSLPCPTPAWTQLDQQEPHCTQ